jgi:hypothetical protein
MIREKATKTAVKREKSFMRLIIFVPPHGFGA